MNLTIHKKQLATILVHFSVWGLLLLLPYLVMSYGGGVNWVAGGPSPYWLPLSSTLGFVLIFYLNYYLLLPKIGERKGWQAYLLISFLVLVLCLFLQVGLRQVLFQDSFPMIQASTLILRRLSLFMLILLHLLVWGVSTGLWLLKKWKHSEERLQESEHKNTLAELDRLRKQINPHFLFNTLNSIYALALLKKETAPDAILSLSKLMSYILTDAGKNAVDLRKDIAYLEHYIALNRLRLTDSSPLYFTSLKDSGAYQIAPLLLLSFVENAFKYGISNVGQAPIEINLSLVDDQLHFYCKNKINTYAVETEEKIGTGIQNTRRRLELLYPGQHELKIESDGKQYVVNLWIRLNE
ncbi:MAG: sensor histidine kinase [Bacteroidota bacterium]